MSDAIEIINVIDRLSIRNEDYRRHFAGCLILTQAGQLMLQQRDDHCERSPGMLATFGGEVEPGESAEQGLIRELREELGAKVNLSESIYLGAFTKLGLDHALIHAYWWRDDAGTITGCYEGKPVLFRSAADILKQPNITADVNWIVTECLKRKLIV